MKKYILGSSSPRRQYLLKELNIDFEIIKPDFDEDILGKNFSYELIEEIAKNKALSIKNKIDFETIIISADTVVINNNIVLGKPIDFNDALKMLKGLNNKTHKVVTAVCVLNTKTNSIITSSRRKPSERPRRGDRSSRGRWGRRSSKGCRRRRRC